MNKISKFSKISPNEYYAKLIKDAYIGEDSETYLMLQFLYFSYILSNFENDFVSSLYTIAQDDIDHHLLLGECIVKLGGDPDFISNKNTPLSGMNFEYLKSIKSILDYGIELKEKSIIKYKILINKIVEKEIKNILETILIDEQKHKEMLINMRKKF